MSSRFQKAVLVLLLAALTPYLWLSFYAHPAADDFFFPAFISRENIWESFLQRYLEWSGRYSSTFLAFLNPLYQGPGSYGIFPLILITGTWAAVHYMIRPVLQAHVSSLQHLNISLVIVLIYLHMMPDLAEGIYWFSASVSYQAGIIAALFYAGLLIRYRRGNYLLNKSVHFVATGILLFLAMGFNEVQTLLLLSFHFLYAAQAVIRKKKISGMKVLILLIAVSGAGIMIFSPGNEVRSAYYDVNHRLFHSLGYSFLQSIRFSMSWILDPALLLFIFWSAGKNILDPTAEKLNVPAWMFALIGGWIVFACAFPAYWSTDILGQHRTINTACLFFIMAACLFVPGLLTGQSKYKSRISGWISQNEKVVWISLIILLISTRNGWTIVQDLGSGHAATFNREMADRWKHLADPSLQGQDVQVDTLTVRPTSLYILDPTSDTAYWVNQCQAKYFGLHSVALRK